MASLEGGFYGEGKRQVSDKQSEAQDALGKLAAKFIKDRNSPGVIPELVTGEVYMVESRQLLLGLDLKPGYTVASLR